jgi:hypothetical protein
MKRFSVWIFILSAFLAPARSAESSGNWYPAVVDKMAGRYGAFMEGYRYRKLGHLTLISDGVDVYSITMGDNIFLGRPYLPPAYSYDESFNWIGVQRNIRFNGGDATGQWLKIYESLAAPGFLYETNQRLFRWCFLEQLPGQGFVLPLASGAVCRREGTRYLSGVDGPLSSSWLLVTFSGSQQPHDCPLLFIFEHPPEKIELVTHEFLDMRFDRPAGKIVVMPLYGLLKTEHKTTASWFESVPRKLVEQCNAWRERMQHYPVSCSEEYSFSEDGLKLTVRDTYEYVSFDGAKSPETAPIPPFVNTARLTGYPVELQGKIIETGYPTYYGPLDYLEGETLTYTVPACSYVDRTLAPVRVKGVKGIGEIEKALAAYIERPAWLWPGDHDYKPDDVMDTLHNLRLLAWATWSLPDSKRREAVKDLAEPGLGRIGDANNSYYYFKDPVAGAVYARDSTIFAQRGKTSYDSDWYNGFQLAGLWAYRYFGDREKGLELARRHWPLWTALRNYMEIYHDWAICCNVVDPRGNLTDFDCMRNGWSGLLAYARLARDLGHHEQYRQTKFLASKTMVAHHVQWNLQKFLHEWSAAYAPDSGKALLRHAKKDITGIEGLDGYGRIRVVSPDDGSPYNLSANIPEHSLFLDDFGLKDMAAHLTYDLLPKHIPDWADFDPNTYNGGQGHWSSANAVGGRYFYSLDPHLFLRSINFNESVEKILSSRKLEWLSGQAIEAMLVGSRPMLVIPTDVEFYGNLWDERDRSLTFTLGTKGTAKQVEVQIRNCPGIKKISPDTSYDYNPQTRRAVLSLEISGKHRTKLNFK